MLKGHINMLKGHVNQSKTRGVLPFSKKVACGAKLLPDFPRPQGGTRARSSGARERGFPYRFRAGSPPVF